MSSTFLMMFVSNMEAHMIYNGSLRVYTKARIRCLVLPIHYPAQSGFLRLIRYTSQGSHYLLVFALISPSWRLCSSMTWRQIPKRYDSHVYDASDDLEADSFTGIEALLGVKRGGTVSCPDIDHNGSPNRVLGSLQLHKRHRKCSVSAFDSFKLCVVSASPKWVLKRIFLLLLALYAWLSLISVRFAIAVLQLTPESMQQDMVWEVFHDPFAFSLARDSNLSPTNWFRFLTFIQEIPGCFIKIAVQSGLIFVSCCFLNNV